MSTRHPLLSPELRNRLAKAVLEARRTAEAAGPAEGDPPLDIFVRWRLCPLLHAQLRSGGQKGAGILRSKPNITWSKDQGNEPEFWSCWGGGTERQRTDFHGGPDFDGSRWNDLHYTRAAKEAARTADR